MAAVAPPPGQLLGGGCFPPIVSITLAFALVAPAAFAAGESDSDSSAATTEQEMVLDPSTGKMVSKPVYGGTLTILPNNISGSYASWDLYINSVSAWPNSLVHDHLAIGDWAADRNKFPFNYTWTNPDTLRDHVAESWEQLSPTSWSITLRQGVRWHNKAPMNGRELTAEDVVWSLHRFCGCGSGFTEVPPSAISFQLFKWKSITATDRYTLKVELEEPHLDAFDSFMLGSWEAGWIIPPEVIKARGDYNDWEAWVGTGPFMMVEHVPDSRLVYQKNPNYFAFDEKYPENKLPYVDEIVQVIMPDAATQKAALRSGQLDVQADGVSGTDQQSLRQSNPELNIYSGTNLCECFGLRLDFELQGRFPFQDKRVRHAMQAAVDLEAINDAVYGGLGDTTPHGQLNRNMTGYNYPYAEWPQELKDQYAYNPEPAKRLLEEAGYPDGFEVTLDMTSSDINTIGNSELAQVVKGYLSEIGIDMKLNPMDTAAFVARRTSQTMSPMTFQGYSYTWAPLSLLGNQHYEGVSDWRVTFAGAPQNWSGRELYPDYHDLVDGVTASTTLEEAKAGSRRADEYSIRENWYLWLPLAPEFTIAQPWVKGYNGETNLGGGTFGHVYARLWIDKN